MDRVAFLRDDSLSLDGKRRCAFRAEGRELAITTISSGAVHVFSVHPDDVRYTKEATCKWAGARHVILQAARLGLVDAGTLKMNYPVQREDEVAYNFSRDGTWVLRRGLSGGIAIARVVSGSP